MNPEEVMKEIEEEARSKFLPIIGPAKGTILDSLVIRTRPRRVLEVGTLVGYSAIRIGRLLPAGGSMTCIEVDGRMAQRAKKNIERAGLSGKVSVLVGDAKHVIPTLKHTLDMLFLDAAKDEYLSYLKLAEPLLHKGSVVVADNVIVFADEMKDYLDYVRMSGIYRSECIEAALASDPGTMDGIEVSVML
jgi:predicted O-methyltransferase YrrM